QPPVDEGGTGNNIDTLPIDHNDGLFGERSHAGRVVFLLHRMNCTFVLVSREILVEMRMMQLSLSHCSLNYYCRQQISRVRVPQHPSNSMVS
ncbi:hypothetical protein BaRGS_00015266, partial [Batillaria attramentaria]